MFKILILSIFSTILFAITPQKIVFDSYISKLALNQKYLAVSLENGDVVIKTYKTLKNIYTIHLPKIEDFMGDKIAMPVYSLDLKNNKLLILAGGEDNSKIVFIFDIKTKKLDKIINTNDSLMRAKFVKDKILFVYLSDEISLYDIKTKKYLYKNQIGNYVFSTWSVKNNIVAIGDESGDIKIADIFSGKKLMIIKGFNKDQTLSLDMYKNLIINGSSDKRVAIYDMKTKSSIIEMKAKFLPYGATITKNKFAFSFNDKNDIALYDFNKKMKLLKGHTMALNGMKFIDDKTLISYSPAEILIWKIDGKN